ncbi:hypothetical protein KIPB_017347, partial [Kipferlia bialata]
LLCRTLMSRGSRRSPLLPVPVASP